MGWDAEERVQELLRWDKKGIGRKGPVILGDEIKERIRIG
jgi:hypothetical protein